MRSAEEMRALYDRTARHYDLASALYKVTGIERRRSQLIEAMRLPVGGTVIDLGTGTGVNLQRLADAVGSEGKIIGVDLSPGMLARARAKTRHLPHVELVECNLHDYAFPAPVDGIISTFALEFVPEYPAVLAAAAASLVPGGALALMGLKYPERWPAWLADIGIWFNRSFGVTREHRDFRPWLAGAEHCPAESFEELYFGSAYAWLGRRESAH